MNPDAFPVKPIVLPPDTLLQAAARRIVEANWDRLPDLSQVTVLLPNLHAGPDFARALASAAGVPTLMLPRLMTLKDWAQAVPVAVPFLPETEREVQLFEALRERGWFPEHDLWAVAGELLRLLDELTRYRVSLPESLEGFVAQLEAAYQARASESLRFEARVAFEAWRAMAHQNVGRADAVARYHLQLARLAEDASGPLVAVDPGPLTPAERDFLAAYSQRFPVTVFVSDPKAGDERSTARLLAAAWRFPSEVSPVPDLRARAAAFRADCAKSPLSGRLRFFPARSLEQEAQAAEIQVRAWLLEGRRRIAVVAQDRLVARRVRALLERAQVLVEDETGWRLSTVAAATAIMRLLDCLGSGFYYQELLDLIKSPFIFCDWPPEARKRAAYSLEQRLRGGTVVSHLDRYLELVKGDEEGEPARAALMRLKDASRPLLAPHPRPLAAWLADLGRSLELLGIGEGLRADAAGCELVQLLERLEGELQGVATELSFGEWRRWLERRLEGETFRDRDIESPVVFTHLAATRLREFDGVVLLGCDAAHFPGRGEDGLFFNQAVRRELGLPTRREELEQAASDLIGLFSRSRAALITWQDQRNAEPNLIAPAFELLQAFHQLAYGDDLLDLGWESLIPSAQVGVAGGETCEIGLRHPPCPRLPCDLVPASISPTGYNSLMACPYQFYARHVLGLNELDEVREEPEKRDYGEYVHRILLEFHRRYPTVSGVEPERLEEELNAISDQVFAEALEASYLARAWALRWKALVPDYLDWQRRREEEGWRWAGGEVAREREIPLAGNRALVLRGRLDRLDCRNEESGARFAVLDYKAQSAEVLRKRVASPGEDVQLPVYGLLQEGCGRAEYLSLDRDRVVAVPLPQEPQALSLEVGKRLAALFDAFYQGEPLPANGIDAACAWCEMRALCRRDYWA